jgi:hypothetical protein
MGEPGPDVLRGVHDLDGAALAASVPGLLGHVLDGHGRPVQGIQVSPEPGRVLL